MLKSSLYLKSLTLAAFLLGAGSSAKATLVGHWLNGDTNLTDASGFTTAGTHDGVAVGPNAGLLAYSSDVPMGFTGQSLSLVGNVAVSIANSSSADGGTYQNTFDGGISSECTIAFWAKGFPGTWAPWVGKRGEGGIGWQVRRMAGANVAGFTVRGVGNEDGWGSPIDVAAGQPAWRHYAAVWNQAAGTRDLYIDGAFSHTVASTPGDDMSLAAAHRLVLGARTDGGGTGYEGYFTGNLYDVRIYNTSLTQPDVAALTLPAVTGLVTVPGNGKVGLSWTSLPSATSYTVWTKDTVTNVEETDTATSALFEKTGLVNARPYLFKVRANNGAVNGAYSAELGATPVMSSGKDILTFAFGISGNATISGTNITKYLPSSANVTNLAPTFTTSFFSTASPASGTARDFTFPQTYTITAEDGSTKTYTVSVALATPITYDFTGGLQGWQQIQPTLPAVLWQTNALGSGYDGIAPDDTFTRFGRSPIFYLLDSGPLTFSLNGGSSPLAVPHVGPSSIPAEAIQNGGFAGVALRDVATNSYVLSRRKSANGGIEQMQFTAAELAPFANDGKQYTLDYLDYNRGSWGWTYLDDVSIPGVAAEPGTEALITSLKMGSLGLTEISGTDITVWLPYGTDVTALNPLIAVSPEAVLSPSLGTSRNFTTPQVYTVTSGDSLVTTNYTVTVITAGSLNVKTYDTTSGVTFLEPISNLQAVTPTATSIQVGDISYGNFVTGLPGVTSPETFAVLWDGWFDVAKDGPGYYTFGSDSDDGSVIYLDLNNDGDFDDLGELVMNNNGLHGVNAPRTGTVYLPMDTVRIAIGYFEESGAEGIDVRFGLGAGQAFASLQRISGKTGHFRATEPAADPSSAVLWNLTSTGRVAQLYGSPTDLLILLPEGTSLTNLAPTFNLSPGAVSVPPSGTVRDFTTPQTYTVTSQDTNTVTTFTIIARAATPIEMTTYQGVSGIAMLAPLSNLQAQTATSTTNTTNEIIHESDAAFLALPGLTSADNFSIIWEGWFNVAADGAGEYTFGTRSDDGSVFCLDFNDDGDFDDTGEIIVNNNALQASTIRTHTVKLQMDKIRFAIGYFEVGGGQVMEARFGKGDSLSWTELTRVSGNTGLFSIAEPASNPSSAVLWYANYAGSVAVPTNPECTELEIALPLGNDITDLALEFSVSPGATCVPPSGTPRNFTTAQTYTVTSADSTESTIYTISVSHLFQSYDYNNGNLQGWKNLVWDLSANGGSGGWIELAPNATTMPATVNGGVIQPTSVNNGLFAITNGQVFYNGNGDTRLNTQRLRSPAFYLDAVADLTLQLRGGVANTTDPTNEGDVPFAAVTNATGAAPGGWKGAVLRRVSDGAFLIAKPRTGANGDAFGTVTFTEAELEPYDGVACTIELINTDRGGWGWVAMDNVYIPTTGLVPLSSYDTWRANYSPLVGTAGQPGQNPDGDLYSNVLEYAFGLNPSVSESGPIEYLAGGAVTNRGGSAIVEDGGVWYAVFGRRADHATSGLTYTVQFSNDLNHWASPAVTLTPVASDSEIEAVEVQFPNTINTPSGPMKPTFMRVEVTHP